MYFMELVVDKSMRRNSHDDSTWAGLNMMLDEDGDLVLGSFRGHSARSGEANASEGGRPNCRGAVPLGAATGQLGCWGASGS